MKILIIDDSSTFRKIIAEELADPEYSFVFATDGEEAISIITEDQSFDLIITDVEMPGLNGLETYEKIIDLSFNGVTKCFPIIFVTSSDSMEYRKQGFELGAIEFIQKDFEKGEFKLIVDKILRPLRFSRNFTALVAEDSSVAAKLVIRILNREGINVIYAEDGEEALNKYQENKDHIDLIITDDNMPKIQGTTLVEKIRKEFGDRDTPIMAFTGTDDADSIVTFFRLGANDYITKPYIKEEFVSRVHAQLESHHLKKLFKKNIKQLKDLNQLKDDFLTICSHDLRSPLNVILGYADILDDDNSLQEEQKSYVKSIIKSSNFLLDLINDLLDLRKIESESEINKSPIVFVPFILEVSESMNKVSSSKGVMLNFINQINNEVSRIEGDKVALTRAVNNLLSNAIKFTPKGKKVCLTIGEIGKEFFIEVSDEGIGIREDLIGKVFQKFTKTSQAGTSGEKGTGLGLSITKEIVEKHGGKLTVFSEGEGKGTAFTIYLPKFN